MRTSSSKQILLFLIMILIFGIFTGFLFYSFQNDTTKTTILSNLTNLFSKNVFSINDIFIHLLVYLIILILAFIFLAIPVLTIYIFFEGISIGFVLSIFLNLYKFKSLIYFFGYTVIIKLLFILLLFILFIKLITFTKDYFKHLKNKNTTYINSLKKCFIILAILFINDLFIYFVGNKILILLFG